MSRPPRVRAVKASRVRVGDRVLFPDHPRPTAVEEVDTASNRYGLITLRAGTATRRVDPGAYVYVYLAPVTSRVPASR